MLWPSLTTYAAALTFGLLTTQTDARSGAQDLKSRQSNNGYSNCPQKLAYPDQCGKDYDYTGFPQDQQARADAVVEQFRFAWDGYRQYAFPHDVLLPLNNSYGDPRNGWGLTAIDGLDTAIIMEQKDIVNDILKFIPTVDFTKNNSPDPDSITTSLFETTIRYLAGMLSSYDLLKGPFKGMASNDSEVDALLSQAKTLADTLKFAFNTDTGLPVGQLFIDNQTFAEEPINGQYFAGLAEFGTLVLEWQHLSDLTGDPQYGELAQRAESYYFKAPGVWPGLTGGNYSINTGQVLDDYGGWVSGNDSAYEYLIKMYVYDPDKYQEYRDYWVKAADSTIAHLVTSPSSRPDLQMAGAFAGHQEENYSEQLACFIGGNFLLASTVLHNEQYEKYGLAFSECFLQPLGLFIPDNQVFFGGQSPEAVESWYYAYQTTKNQYWRDVAWAYTVAQNTSIRAGSGFTDCLNVLEPNGGGHSPELNEMQSFMLAEVLKYQYLIQTPKTGEWQVQEGKDKKNYFVYNTECHPFRVRTDKPV